VQETIASGKYLTPDVGGTASTKDMADAIAGFCSSVSVG
jgi:isocitrate/isopropylmalate dehydrogenase